MNFLADTNVLSEPLRPAPNPGVMAGLQRHRDGIAIAAPAWNELLFGSFLLPPSRRRRELDAYLRQVLHPCFPILPYDEIAAEWHARERARLGRAGKTPPFVDGQIAAIARVNGLVLVTANVQDYQAFSGLRVEDWRS